VPEYKMIYFEINERIMNNEKFQAITNAEICYTLSNIILKKHIYTRQSQNHDLISVLII